LASSFFSKVKKHFRFFNLDFLEIILWSQGCSGLSIIKKKKVMSASFKRRVWSLLVAVGSLLRLHPKHHVTFNKVGRLVLAFMAQRSSGNNFFPPPLFSLHHLKRSAGFAKLQSDP
jgi:hypothetical protein